MTLVGVQTAVPAFIGYTQKAELGGKPLLNRPVQVGSLADYEESFGTGFQPEHTLGEVTDAARIQAGDFDFQVPDSDTGTVEYYDLTSASAFNLYNSMRLFYANGGGTCWVVSVGTYRDASGNPVLIEAGPLQEGLNAISEQSGPTMLVVPDAVLLPPDDAATPFVSAGFQQIVDAMLQQCAKLQDRVAILDVYGSLLATKSNLPDLIGQFRASIGADATARSYGMAYFPFLDTSVVTLDEIGLANVAEASLDRLKEMLTYQNANLYSSDARRLAAVQAEIDAIAAGLPPERVTVLDRNLSAALPLLVEIKRTIVREVSKLPPSGAMAGVYTCVDNSRGVWTAPANMSLNAVVKPTFRLDNESQADLDVPVDGKAIDALRELAGQGTIVWGARTLDGNSNDYRYVQVRRTLIYIEQSIKNALDLFVFAPNDGNTWAQVVSMVSGFLQDLWIRGGLMGATAQEAFSVQCGLGSTMTPTDILEGYMVVQVTLQMIRPAEFIELTFKQMMEG